MVASLSSSIQAQQQQHHTSEDTQRGEVSEFLYDAAVPRIANLDQVEKKMVGDCPGVAEKIFLNTKKSIQ